MLLPDINLLPDTICYVGFCSIRCERLNPQLVCDVSAPATMCDCIHGKVADTCDTSYIPDKCQDHVISDVGIMCIT